jgi:hypothetical protein
MNRGLTYNDLHSIWGREAKAGGIKKAAMWQPFGVLIEHAFN